MEEKILKSFIKHKGKEVENLDLMVALPDNFEDCPTCQVMEKEMNGKVWDVICTKSGRVKEILLL